MALKMADDITTEVSNAIANATTGEILRKRRRAIWDEIEEMQSNIDPEEARKERVKI
jgi:hypothetical protein